MTPKSYNKVLMSMFNYNVLNEQENILNEQEKIHKQLLQEYIKKVSEITGKDNAIRFIVGVEFLRGNNYGELDSTKISPFDKCQVEILDEIDETLIEEIIKIMDKIEATGVSNEK